jgi:UPF0176 protein
MTSTQTPATSITNIAAYKFAQLTELKPLREQLLTQCRAWGLRGTILLSTEGINLFVAGYAAEIDQLLAALRAIPGLEELTPKISLSDDQPFERMLVKIKKEIISFGVEGIEPGRRTSPKLAARELKAWMDEGRSITLLDTRNDYEVKLGTFRNALPIGIDNFREFPAAVQKLPAEMKQQPIVMFCTGGIRCEKAGPFMEREGFEHIYQLDGGILKYFEECGHDHYDGSCFVFERRVGLDPNLGETSNAQCFACLEPLTVREQCDPRYVPGQSCPHCFRTPEERLAETIAERHAAIRQITTPLPGSQPYDNVRPLNVPANCEGRTLLEFLGIILRHVPREFWENLIEQKLLLDNAHLPVTGDRIVRAGERYEHLEPATVEPDVNAAIELLYEDEAILVLNKPAPLPMHPSGRFNRNTLQHILKEVYAPQRPRPAHRLDANTTGVVVFARTRHVAGILQPQFTQGCIEKTYRAQVQGHPPEDQFRCTAPIKASAGELGSRDVDYANGLPARTDFTVLERRPDGTSILEVTPVTGRTNQIRVHLWELGWPICGDQVYLPGKQLGDTQTTTVDAAPLRLHAQRISFLHPITKQRVAFEAQAHWA